MAVLALLLLLVLLPTAAPTLSPGRYVEACPRAEAIVRAGVAKAVRAEPRMAASLVRLHFHDCFVQGCDGSVLLDGTTSSPGEKNTPPNDKSARGFDIIDTIKADLESACPGIVSCADLLTMAARDSIVESGGPNWTVELGRLDGRKARPELTSNLPSPLFNSSSSLIASFANVGLGSKDMVALSGAHTLGKAHCGFLSGRLTANTSASAVFLPPRTDPDFQRRLDAFCSKNGLSALADLDPVSPARFDNSYYQNLLAGRGLLISDMALVAAASGDVADLVQTYADDEGKFFTDFAQSMLAMGRLAPPEGTSRGEVRRNCRRANT